MNNRLSDVHKKRFYIISFVVSPILFIIGYYVSTKIAIALDFFVDRKGLIFVAFILLLSYLKSIHTVYKILLRNENDHKK